MRYSSVENWSLDTYNLNTKRAIVQESGYMEWVGGNMGSNTQWIITDEALNILELPDTNVFDFEGVALGVCLIWNVTYDSIAGLAVGQNAANLTGCKELSNSKELFLEDMCR